MAKVIMTITDTDNNTSINTNLKFVPAIKTDVRPTGAHHMSMIALMAIKASCSGELSNSAAVNVVIGKCKNDIAQIEEDPRYPRNHEQFANIQINAPLALIQLEMKTRVAALQSVIDFASGM